MSPTRYSIGDVISVDGEALLVVGIAAARKDPNRTLFRYVDVFDTNRTLFRYVDVFDERDDVEVILPGAETEQTEPTVEVDPEPEEPKADDAADAELEDEPDEIKPEK